MNEMVNVVIVLARCAHRLQCFGIRFEEHEPNQWFADWAFPLKGETAKREQYDQMRISGTLSFAPAYPGCPFCEAQSMFQCHCGGNACWNRRPKVRCPWCGEVVLLTQQVESLIAGTDR